MAIVFIYSHIRVNVQSNSRLRIYATTSTFEIVISLSVRDEMPSFQKLALHATIATITGRSVFVAPIM